MAPSCGARARRTGHWHERVVGLWLRHSSRAVCLRCGADRVKQGGVKQEVCARVLRRPRDGALLFVGRSACGVGRAMPRARVLRRVGAVAERAGGCARTACAVKVEGLLEHGAHADLPTCGLRASGLRAVIPRAAVSSANCRRALYSTGLRQPGPAPCSGAWGGAHTASGRGRCEARCAPPVLGRGNSGGCRGLLRVHHPHISR
jgi:hypothetical protein